jgi:hypothetical protein
VVHGAIPENLPLHWSEARVGNGRIYCCSTNGQLVRIIHERSTAAPTGERGARVCPETPAGEGDWSG